MFYVLLALLALPFVRRRSSGEVRTILVVQTGKIGDFVCTTPLFRALRAHYPAARIVLALHPVNSVLARQLPFFDELLEIPSGTLSGWRHKWRWVAEVRRLNPDLALCCSGGAAWPFILAMAGVPRRLGVTPNFLGRSSRFAQRLWTEAVVHDGGRLIGSTYARLLALLGVDAVALDKVVGHPAAAEAKVEAFLAGQGGRRLAGLAISSANKLKELGEEKLIGICRRLLVAAPDLSIVLLGGPGDRAAAAALGAGLDASRLVDSCGVFSLDEVPALLQRLDVFIGVDSGLTYMADALDIPLVSLAGPCNMQETRPVNRRAVILQESLPCIPCAHIFKAPYACRIGSRACIVDVPAERVADAALALLAEPGRPRA